MIESAVGNTKDMKKIGQFGPFLVLEHQLPHGEIRIWLAREEKAGKLNLLRYYRFDEDHPKSQNAHKEAISLFNACAKELSRRFAENPIFCEKNFHEQQQREESKLVFYNEYSFDCFKIGQIMKSDHEDQIGLWLYLESKEWVNIWLSSIHSHYDEKTDAPLDWQDVEIEKAKAFGQSILDLLKTNKQTAKKYVQKLIRSSAHRINDKDLDLWLVGFPADNLDGANSLAKQNKN